MPQFIKHWREEGIKSLTKFVFLGEIVSSLDSQKLYSIWDGNFRYSTTENMIIIKDRTDLPESIFKVLEQFNFCYPCMLTKQHNIKVIQSILPWVTNSLGAEEELPLHSRLVLYRYVIVRGQIEIKLIRILDESYNPHIKMFPIGKRKKSQEQKLIPLVDSITDFGFPTYPEVFGAPNVFYYSKKLYRVQHQMVLAIPISPMINQPIYKDSQVIIIEFESVYIRNANGFIQFQSHSSNEEIEVIEQNYEKELEFLKGLQQNIINNGMYFLQKDIHYLHMNVKTQLLTVVTGQHGSGKTTLCDLYVKSLGGNLGDNYLFVQTNTKWESFDDMWEDLNNTSLSNVSLRDFFLAANKNKETLYFVVFDDINMARFENVFHPLLTVLEKTGNERCLSLQKHQNNFGRNAESSILLGDNLVFLATASEDIVSNPFIPKSIDRISIVELSNLYFRKLEANECVIETGLNPYDCKVEMYRRKWFKHIEPLLMFTESELKLFDSLNDLLGERTPQVQITLRMINKISRIIGNIPASLDEIPFKSRGEWIDRCVKEQLLPKIYGNHPALRSLLGEYNGTKWIKGELVQLFESDYAKEVSNFYETIQKLHKKAKELEYEGFAY